MAYLTNMEAVTRYLEDVTNGGLRREGAARRGYSSSTVAVNTDGALIYHRTAATRRRAWGPVTLCVFSERTRTLVLNGDGFTDGAATRWQTNLRVIVLNSLGGESEIVTPRPRVNLGPRTRYVIVPYAALGAAGIDPRSVDPIDVTEDRWEQVWHEVPQPPKRELFRMTNETRMERVWEATQGGHRYRFTQGPQRMVRNRNTGESKPWDWSLRASPEWVEENGWQDRMEGWGADRTLAIQVWASGERVQAGWQRLEVRGGAHGWEERIHHLGASVFRAVDESGQRKRFISAFDEDEPGQLYYLAQLPAKNRVRTYREAVEALAPPIVKEARRAGRTVLRQGDVFAIETDRTDDWVYSRAKTRVRRSVALHDPTRQGVVPPEMDERDHRERATCPCCGKPARVGWGPRCRRALMIYGTSHTATEVVVVSGGAVYIRGVMHHDPRLEDPTRRPEHATVNLGDGSRWYLAVRNTVPRRRPQNNGAQREEESA